MAGTLVDFFARGLGSFSRPSDFLNQLRLKVNLEPEFWARGMIFYRYQTIFFQEEAAAHLVQGPG